MHANGADVAASPLDGYTHLTSIVMGIEQARMMTYTPRGTLISNPTLLLPFVYDETIFHRNRNLAEGAMVLYAETNISDPVRTKHYYMVRAQVSLDLTEELQERFPEPGALKSFRNNFSSSRLEDPRFKLSM